MPPPTVQSDRRSRDQGSTVARRQRAHRWRVLGARVAILVVALGSWQLLTAKGVLDKFFVGQPSGIGERLWDWFAHGTPVGSIWAQIAVTLEEAVLGLAIGVALGVLFGIVLGRSAFLADILSPFIKGANAMPRIVFGSIFIVWLGLGVSSKVMLATVLVFFPVFFNAFQGARDIDANLVASVRILGASRLKVITHVVVPSALSWIAASLHTAYGFALIGAVVGEFLGATQGLGVLISQSQGSFDTDGLFAAMVILGVIALSLESLISIAERRLLSWQPSRNGEGDHY